MNIEFFKEMIHDINDLNLSDDFKDFSQESFIIFMLCNLYERMKEELITIKSLSEKLSILDFIKSTTPLLKKIGIIIEIDRNIQKKLIKEMYIPHIRSVMINH